MASLKSLKSKLHGIKLTLNQCSQAIDIIDLTNPSPYDVEEIKIWHKQWQPLLSSVNKIHSQMRDLTEDEDELEAIDNENNNLCTQYMKIGKIINKIMSLDETPAIQTVSPDTKVPLCTDEDMHLASINIPTFTGNIEQWDSFKSTFESLVHNQIKYSNFKKLHILRRSLKDEAFDTIASVQLDPNNYELCWNLLMTAYDNKRKMISHHLNSFLKIPAVTSENSSKLRATAALIRKHIKALENIIPEENRWNHIVAILISKKLDSETKRHWLGSNIAQSDYQDIDSMLSFILERAHQLDEHSCDSHIPQRVKTHKALVVSQSDKCIFCKKDHYLRQCNNFLQLTIRARINEARKRNLCLNCLRKGHAANICNSKYSCNICNKKHHTLLHIVTEESDISTPNTSISSTLTAHVHQTNQVMLSTALVKILDKHGKSITARALLDNGSQTSFITNNLIKKLKLPTTQSAVVITGIGNSETKITKQAKIALHSATTNFKTFVNCLLIDKITDNIPHIELDINNLTLPSNIRLADPSFNKSKSIDILLGADLFWKLLRVGNTKLVNNRLNLQSTSLGWIVTSYKSNNTNNNAHCYHASLQTQISKFWEVESVKECSPFTLEEQACQTHFEKTTTRDSDGRFVVMLPFKLPTSMLGDSKTAATKRFLSLERKFANNAQFKSMYSSFVQEYMRLGHMTLNASQTTSAPSYFLPHHGILKLSSTTSKLRVVFDGSMSSSTNTSLNSLQANGPTIQNDLFTILTKFRQYEYVVAADIAMMYRQILVHPSQRNLQQILWRDNPDDKLQCYQLNTLTYGTLSAAYLAIRSLTQLGYDNKNAHPNAANTIINDFYVDDMLTGSNDLSELKQRCNKIIEILSSAGFNLRKWISNDPAVLVDLDNTTNDKHFYIQDSDVDTFKTLGVMWNSETDCFKYSIAYADPHIKLTKRNILSFIAKLFDPLGLLSPCVIPFKLMIQQLWQTNLHWDDEVPEHLANIWTTLTKQLPHLNNVSIPRMTLISKFVNIEVHGFCDASERAYGACIYIKSTNSEGISKATLLHSKSKVAPLKSLTIPCLELSAALLLSRMIKKLLQILSVPVNRVVLWSDSVIVLTWLKCIPNTLKTFVANRVAEIQTDMNSITQWRHVNTESNPADLISRGILAKNIIDYNFWWQGPDWLLKPEQLWPNSSCTVNCLPETKTIILANLATSTSNPIFDTYSNLRTLNRVTAYCLRFIFNCRNKQNKANGILTVTELQDSMQLLVKIAQSECFASEFNALKSNKPLSNKSTLLCLNPFLDDNDIIRVGNRLKYSKVDYHKRHPIVLPNKHKLTTLLMEKEHLRLFHPGPQKLLFSIRDQYWPIKGISLAKNIVHRCITCFKQKPRFSSPKMGALPFERVSLDFPFKDTGVDYAGPIMVKNKYGRGGKLLKSYICLFICFATKAIHLELVTELTTQCFIAALNRFISRRGKPKTIYSDNGTNFVGASRALGKFLSDQSNATTIQTASSDQSISWKFIPPYSPNWGGLWESNIKSTKSHLKRVIQNNHFTFEDTYTLLTQIEAILNSRPLFPASNDPNDLSPITPGHLIIGRQLTSIAPQEDAPINLSRMQRFLQLQSCIQSFWKRWSNDYLGHCNQISKWKTSTGIAPQAGSLVLIKEPNMPPSQWMLGRVLKVSESDDLTARLATIKTNKGQVQRLIRHLAPLPIID